MSKARLVITAVVLEKRSQAEVARTFGVSAGWVSKLMARYREEGEAAFEPRSRRPKTSPRAFSPAVVDLIIELQRDQRGFRCFLCLATSQGARGRNRTRDIFITSEVLYQLSYSGGLSILDPLGRPHENEKSRPTVPRTLPTRRTGHPAAAPALRPLGHQPRTGVGCGSGPSGFVRTAVHPVGTRPHSEPEGNMGRGSFRSLAVAAGDGAGPHMVKMADVAVKSRHQGKVTKSASGAVTPDRRSGPVRPPNRIRQ